MRWGELIFFTLSSFHSLFFQALDESSWLIIELLTPLSHQENITHGAALDESIGSIKFAIRFRNIRTHMYMCRPKVHETLLLWA